MGFRETKIEGGGLWIEDEDGKSRFEASIMSHNHLKYIFLVIIFRKSYYFEDIVNL